ncbi:hypothetical protein ACIPL1_27540 [Pseudomonas sp. NPDC090202]|uniref:hypothetical protein n=1 Tax=Pseudomonas sp. NPDC090202 TaxID=3364476 RepID=UPI0038154772
MAGLKGLDRSGAEARSRLTDEAAEEFIRAAPLSAPKPAEPAPAPVQKKKAKVAAKSKRVNFSLDDKIDKQIDKVSLWPRSFKATRSDVVRAGIQALMAMPRNEAVELLRSVTGAEADTQDTHDE